MIRSQRGVKVIATKWVLALKTDNDGFITMANERLIAHGSGQKHSVGYFETFATTPPVSFIKAALTIAVQNDRSLYHFDVMQAFVRAPLDTDVANNLPMGCGSKTKDVVELDRALYGVK